MLERWNQPEDRSVSMARARVEAGTTTELHCLEGIDERYLFTSGSGIVDVEGLPPTRVDTGDVVTIPAGASQRVTNTGSVDLLFECICTPAFDPDAYRSLEDNG
jgi:mannose-6-phosphate isomerase-like protein (cupin superfamily)